MDPDTRGVNDRLILAADAFLGAVVDCGTDTTQTRNVNPVPNQVPTRFINN